MPEIFVQKATDILIRNDVGIGLKASQDNPDILVRDALMSTLGLCASKDDHLVRIAKKCIISASKYQKFTGQLPNKITPDERRVCFGEGGCIDSSLWYPIAARNYFIHTRDLGFLREQHRKVEHALSWAISLDQNNDWMIETNAGSDWTDVLLRSGRVLYNNVLLYKALKDADEISNVLGKEEKFAWIAENLKEQINLFMWPTKDSLAEVRAHYGHTGLDKDVETVMINEKNERRFYLAELGYRTYDPRFDSFANILAILFDVAPKDRKESIFNAIKLQSIDAPYPVKVLDPPISKYDPFWNQYFRWTDTPHLQEPGNYHNGGIWPFAGGFYIAALKKEKKPFTREFDGLAKSCEQDNWRFSGWLSSDGRPQGFREETKSAAMLLYAHYC